VTTVEKPLVLDADGLNAFAGSASKLQHKFPRVLTPHPGEMARLLSRSITEVQADRERAVRDCVALTGGVVVLKGAGTLVADGTRLYQNQTGNPGMASGGTGDVLSGMIGALIGQGLSTFDAACLGVYLHGRAGDLVARRIGQHSLIASDLIEALPAAIAKLK
jgi:ADP-dependent NAD(P)H-hydrate dehydratase